jgi:pimeloyl-ACP methyl ester carboxylesterase
MQTHKTKSSLIYLISVWLLSSCAYMESISKQDEYLTKQQTNPGLHNLKHIIDREKIIIIGLLVDEQGKQTEQNLSVAAFSDRFKPHELVDVTHFASTGRHYVLNLPPGEYDLVVLADKDNNKLLKQSEVIGRRRIVLKPDTGETKIPMSFDINLTKKMKLDWPINITVPALPELENSLVYPKGAIRTLDDPIFGPELSTLGLYEPAAFLERAPIQFYTLEEHSLYKIPVIFVHGMGGTPREFIQIIEKIDRERYVPFFYYYPSGNDLKQQAGIFYQVFLSGKLFPRIGPRMIIVAHSMGGLVVREALNLQQKAKNENVVALLITIASPFGGHPDAATGVKHAPMILPAWHKLNPDSEFIRELFRKPLNTTIEHQLLYAYANPDTFKPDENSDGVVPLHSQLRPAAQAQSSRNMGFNSSHAGILKDQNAVNYIVKSIQAIKGYYSEAHVSVMQAGGYDIELDETYNNQQKYLINVLGKYLAALWNGKLAPETPEQQHFVDVAQGRTNAKFITEKTWLKFIKEYPNIFEQTKIKEDP